MRQPTAERIAYSYDASSRRVARTAFSATTTWLYQGVNTVGERNPVASLWNDYLFAPGIDEPLAMATGQNGPVTYFGVDGLGSVVIRTDSSANIVDGARYSPWGEGNGVNALFGYTGREQSDGLWYYRARQYRPDIGRFLSEDPIGFAGGLNTYAYADGDPVSLVDPFGFDPDEPTFCDYSPDDCISLARKIEEVIKKLRRLLKNEYKQREAGKAAEGYEGHLEQWNDRKRQLNKLLKRFSDRNCNPGLVRNDVSQWVNENYPPRQDTFWERYKKNVRRSLNDGWRQIERGPQPQMIPLPPIPLPIPIF